MGSLTAKRRPDFSELTFSSSEDLLSCLEARFVRHTYTMVSGLNIISAVAYLAIQGL